MKKIIRSFFIFFIILSFLPTTYADEKMISFRGIEWGSSPKTAKGAFDSSVRWESSEYGSCFGMDYWTKGEGQIYSGNICETIRSEYSYRNKIKVAGEESSMVVLRFAMVPGHDDPLFVMGEYIFATGNYFDIMFNLSEKLKVLYGKYETAINLSSELDTYYVWKDSDGNTISLCKHGSTALSLRYISSQIDNLFSEATFSEKQNNKFSYDGL